MKARWVLLFAIAAGCATGRGNEGNGDQHDAPPGSPPGIDAPTGGGGGGGGGGGDGGGGDASGGGGGGGGSGLDPELSLPDPSGQVCDAPGIGSPECPVGEVCRFFTSTEGRCESCTAGTCGHAGDSCSATNQCDILFECYQGQCRSFCTLGTLACGTVDDCINIGHATRGVCRQ